MDELQQVAEEWLKVYSYTVATNNVDTHLDLMSRRLQVVGLSEQGFLEYREWATKRRNDMNSRRLLRITFRNLEMKHVTDHRRIRFAVEETIKSTEGESFVIDKEIALALEKDGKWREVEELIKQVRRAPAAHNHNSHPPG